MNWFVNSGTPCGLPQEGWLVHFGEMHLKANLLSHAKAPLREV